MLMIDNQWENVDTLEDIYKVIENKLGDEIIYKLNEIIRIMIDNFSSLEIEDLEQELADKESQNEDLQDEIWELREEIHNLEDEIEELRSR